MPRAKKEAPKATKAPKKLKIEQLADLCTASDVEDKVRELVDAFNS